MRLAHESEARPVYGTWFCDCHGCQVQAHALAFADPLQGVVVKFGAAARRVLSAREWSELCAEHGALAADAICEHGDYVREVFVADGRVAS